MNRKYCENDNRKLERIDASKLSTMMDILFPDLDRCIEDSSGDTTILRSETEIKKQMKTYFDSRRRTLRKKPLNSTANIEKYHSLLSKLLLEQTKLQ